MAPAKTCLTQKEAVQDSSLKFDGFFRSVMAGDTLVTHYSGGDHKKL